MLEPIELYQTTDGKIYETLEAAKEAQAVIDRAGLNSKIRTQVENGLKKLPKYGKFTDSNKSTFSREFGKTDFIGMVLDLAINYPTQFSSAFTIPRPIDGPINELPREE